MYMCVFLVLLYTSTLLSQIREQDEAIGAVCVHVSALCACACWEYMLSLTAGGTWGMELQQSHFTEPVEAKDIFSPKRYQPGEYIRKSMDDTWMRPVV